MCASLSPDRELSLSRSLCSESGPLLSIFICVQVSTIFKVPIAIVSLVETERQWFKSVVGINVQACARAVSFCAWTLLPVNPEVLIVEDAASDPRCESQGLFHACNTLFQCGCERRQKKMPEH